MSEIASTLIKDFLLFRPGIINFIQNGQPKKDLWKKWLEKTEIHDAWRNQNYKETWPFLNMATRDYE